MITNLARSVYVVVMVGSGVLIMVMIKASAWADFAVAWFSLGWWITKGIPFWRDKD